MGRGPISTVTARGRAGFAALAILTAACWTEAWADGSVSVVMYHRFGESEYPSTNIPIAQFESHLAELASGAYTVMALPDIVEALRQERPLPDRTVGLTIDDAYLSVYREAWPRLKEAGLPFTLFVATDPVDQHHPRHMGWSQIRELAAAGVTIGSQTASHLHMAKTDDAGNTADIEKSNARFVSELGRRPDLIAYPYGEASSAVERLARRLGFIAGFGQHSGAIGGTGNLFYLPRFALNEKYGDMARFRRVANVLPLPVSDFTPTDHLVGAVNPPAIGFTVDPGIRGLDRLSCFASHEGRMRIERLGESRFEVRVQTPFPKGRTRINCTLPAAENRWRWLGRQFYMAD
jgi:poly-beta-1,6-N-acetyl-D-glucosamine N-deacetylase